MLEGQRKYMLSLTGLVELHRESASGPVYLGCSILEEGLVVMGEPRAAV